MESESAPEVVLYGSYASYHTAKTRSYLRKKGILFVELPPAAPRFREYVRPASENHRIPQVELADGTVVQDSTAIFDALEERFPEPALRPPGIRQEWACRLIEALTDPALLFVAWHYRWNFMETNYLFVGREFGRSFRPRGDNDEIDHYGRIIADRMEGHRRTIGIDESHFGVLEQAYDEILAILDEHFRTLPYLFGGRPSIADCMLMGGLFGHMARDPEPAMRMKQRAPRVFRWTEHMNTPETVWPELFDEAPDFLAEDEVPETTRALLKVFVSDAGGPIRETAKAFEQWTLDHPEHPAGTPISEKHDEPIFGRATLPYRGVPLPYTLMAHNLWVLQRAQEWRDEVSDADQAKCDELLHSVGGHLFSDLPRPRRLIRVHNRLAVE